MVLQRALNLILPVGLEGWSLVDFLEEVMFIQDLTLRLFQGEGREHPKELMGKGGSRMLETADKLLGWSPRGA